MDWGSSDLNVYKPKEGEQCRCNWKVRVLHTHVQLLKVRCHSSEQVLEPCERFCAWCDGESHTFFVRQQNPATHAKHPVKELHTSDLDSHASNAEDEARRTVMERHLVSRLKGRNCPTYYTTI